MVARLELPSCGSVKSNPENTKFVCLWDTSVFILPFVVWIEFRFNPRSFVNCYVIGQDCSVHCSESVFKWKRAMLGAWCWEYRTTEILKLEVGMIIDMLRKRGHCISKELHEISAICNTLYLPYVVLKVMSETDCSLFWLKTSSKAICL